MLSFKILNLKVRIYNASGIEDWRYHFLEDNTLDSVIDLQVKEQIEAQYRILLFDVGSEVVSFFVGWEFLFVSFFCLS